MNPEKPKATILIVDDNPAVRSSLVRVLSMEGYHTVESGDAEEAYDYLGTHPPPQAIILDILMPGMDPRQLKAEIERIPALARVPIILFSASHTVQAVANELRPFAVLEKPVDVDVLLQTVERACAACILPDTRDSK
jgi:CheY-like chemotaxis protein